MFTDLAVWQPYLPSSAVLSESAAVKFSSNPHMKASGKGDQGFPAHDLALQRDSPCIGSDILAMKHCSDSSSCFPEVISSSDSIQYLNFP